MKLATSTILFIAKIANRFLCCVGFFFLIAYHSRDADIINFVDYTKGIISASIATFFVVWCIEMVSGDALKLIKSYRS